MTQSQPARVATPLSRLPNFDPRQVPVAAVDGHLPAIAPGQLTPAALRQRFSTPPAWQPEVRREPRFADRAPAPAAVLVPPVDQRHQHRRPPRRCWCRWSTGRAACRCC